MIGVVRHSNRRVSWLMAMAWAERKRAARRPLRVERDVIFVCFCIEPLADRSGNPEIPTAEGGNTRNRPL